MLLLPKSSVPVAPHYSFNWAVCSIAIEMEENADRPSEPGLKDRIVEALRNGVRFSALRQALSEPDRKEIEQVQTWLTLNGLDVQEICDAETAPIAA